MENVREELDWGAFGVASRDLAREIADSSQAVGDARFLPSP